MNKINSLILLATLALLTSSALVAPAAAKNLDQMWAETLDAQNNAVYISSNGSTCLTFFYVGTSSEAVISISSFSIQAYAPAGTSDTGFGNGVYTGGYGFGSGTNQYSTIGALVTAINNASPTSKYSASLLGCKYDDSPSIMRDQTALGNSSSVQSIAGLAQTSNLGAIAGYTVYQDTGALAVVGSTQTYYFSLGIDPAQNRRVVLKQCKQSTGGTGTLSVYGALRKYDAANDGVTRNTSSLVWQEPTVANTALTETWAISGWGGLDFGLNQNVVIRAGDGLTASNGTSYLNCEWDER